jgi:NAD(P)-dependent dehydrogenase (short-subunit alcohol dehydrogenase family)
MTVRLKPIKEQVIVITGASSGIGLVTARMAAKRGARVMLTARNHDALKQLADEIVANESDGGMAAFLAADVADEAALRRVADEAVSRFGRIDTWVNGAGVSVYGRLTDVSLEDQRRVFETNFWGVVIGSRIAIPHLRAGGAHQYRECPVRSSRASAGRVLRRQTCGQRLYRLLTNGVGA